MNHTDTQETMTEIAGNIHNAVRTAASPDLDNPPLPAPLMLIAAQAGLYSALISTIMDLNECLLISDEDRAKLLPKAQELCADLQVAIQKQMVLDMISNGAPIEYDDALKELANARDRAVTAQRLRGVN